MLADKMRAIQASGAEVCAAVDSSCLMQIGGGLRREQTGVGVVHPGGDPGEHGGRVRNEFAEAAQSGARELTASANIRDATRTIRAKREEAVAELPDWQQLREAGRAIKERTMRNLDRHLEQLERSVTAAGGAVHWAADAEEANRIVGDLIVATGARDAVKVKSLATDEIGLNRALAARGIEARETDLAELIVQLGDTVRRTFSSRRSTAIAVRYASFSAVRCRETSSSPMIRPSSRRRRGGSCARSS